MFFLNIYQKEKGDIVLKKVQNRHAYQKWKLINTYVIYNDKLYEFEEFRKIIKKPQKINYCKKLINCIKDL